MREKNHERLPAGGEQDIARLLKAAGPRPQIPVEELEAIKATARAEWRRVVDRRIGHPRWSWRSAVPWALAATLLLALSLGWWWRGLQAPTGHAFVASVERAEGSDLLVGRKLAREDVVVTAESSDTTVRLALRLVGGQSVRLDAGSRLRLVDESHLELHRGAVYVDAPEGAGGLEVVTPLGSVRDIGTQFEVRLVEAGTGLRVRVREGSVEIARGARSHAAAAGEELTVGSDGSLDRRAVAPWDRDWKWVWAAAPRLEIEGVSLETYLVWLARETGWRVRFSEETLARSAREVRLHGTIRDLSPDESVHVVLPASGFEYRLEEGVLLIDP